MKTSQKYCSFFIIVLFLLAIFTPLLGSIILEDRTISYTEKRKLKQLPPMPTNIKMLQEFPLKFEEYFNDQFGMREFLLSLFSQLKKSIGDTEISAATGKTPTKKTVKGKKGWYFLNRVWDGDPISDYRNISLFSEIGLLRATLVFAARSYWLQQKGIEYLLVFAPNKHTIYPEYMPDYIVKQGEISNTDQLYDSLSRFTSVTFVDLRPPLIKAKNDAHLYWKGETSDAALYYKTDSHWNGAGANIAQYVIAQHVEKKFPKLITPRLRPQEEFTMRNFSGDISLIMGRDDKAAYGPEIQQGSCSRATPKEYRKRSQVTRCKTGRLHGMIFHDSFYPILKPFFADYFAKTSFRWERMNQRRVLGELKNEHIDVVIEERAERHLPYTPDIGSEPYHDYWALHYPHWRKKVFSINLKKVKKNKQYNPKNLAITYDKSKKTLLLQATTNNPVLYIRRLPLSPRKIYMVKVVLESPANTKTQLYFSRDNPKKKFPDTRHSRTYPIKKGRNTLYIPLLRTDLGTKLRFDPGNVSGRYKLIQFEIKEIDSSSFKKILN